jgi:hypothetical protein
MVRDVSPALRDQHDSVEMAAIQCRDHLFVFYFLLQTFYFDGAPRRHAIAASVLVASHFQHVNHFQSAPTYDCIPQVAQTATN